MLRSVLVALLLATVTASLVPPAGGQGLAAVPLLEDAEGDAIVKAAGSPGPSGSPVYPGADLVGLSLTESSEAFTWVLEVSDLKPASEEPGVDGVRFEVRFEHNGRYFLLHVYRTLPAISSPAAYLDARDASDGEWGQVWFDYQAVALDFAADTLTVVLPRPLLADADGAPPFPGRNLTAISVRSTTMMGGGLIFTGPSPLLVPYTITDDMPEADEAPASYAIVVGVQQLGHAHLASPTPFRASNGEATTFVYEVEASNTGDDNETFQLAAVDVPPRLSVVLPVPTLPIPSNGSVTVPVLVTVPFSHEHGALDKFLLELTSLDDPQSIGRLEMGVNYLAIPQPAGHHDVLFLHNPPAQATVPGLNSGLLPWRTGTMNTVDATEPEPVFPGNSYNIGLPFSAYFWDFGLAPALQMGLDVDLERVGAFTATIGTTVPIMQASLEGQLYVVGHEDGTVLLGSLAPMAPIDLPAQGRHEVSLDFVPHEDGDAVPLVPGSNLVFTLTLEGTTVGVLDQGQTGPYLEPGATLQLPLNEWHDDVDDALASVDGPLLSAVGAQERFVNPGEAAVVNVTLENPLNESVPYRLAVTGLNVEWATLTDTAFYLPPESNTTVPLIVRAPATALDGDRADLIVQAWPRDEPEVRSLVRFVIEVDTDADHPDDAPLAKRLGKKDSPGPMPVLSAIALLALAVRRRR